MFILSLKMSQKKQILCVAVVALVAVSVLVTLLAVNPITSVQKTIQKPKNNSMNSTEKITEYLKGFGWEVDQDAVEIKQVVIPLEFNDIYKQYNEVQKKQKFDLDRYRGKTVKQYSFAITNYPDHPQNVRAHVLLDGDTIIGGDISLLELNGFTHGFEAP